MRKKPAPTARDLRSAYAKMAKDKKRETEALEWAEATLKNAPVPEKPTEVSNPNRAAIERIQRLVRRYVPKGRSLADELIEERRREVARERGDAERERDLG